MKNSNDYYARKLYKAIHDEFGPLNDYIDKVIWKEFKRLNKQEQEFLIPEDLYKFGHAEKILMYIICILENRIYFERGLKKIDNKRRKRSEEKIIE